MNFSFSAKKLALSSAYLLLFSSFSPLCAFALEQSAQAPGAEAVNSVSVSNTGFVATSAADRTEAKNFQKPVLKGRPKLGLALGGGGARGAAEVGVLKVLGKEGIVFDCVTGTSVGAVIGGFYCLGYSGDEMEESFVRGDVMRNFMTVPLSFRILVAPLLLIPRIFSHEYDGLYKGNQFRNYLVKNMPEKNQMIEDLKIPFGAMALNLIDGKPYMIRSGHLGYAMQASSAVPSLRKPVEIDGRLFVDGGVICNLPVKQCRELGADIVIAVNIDEPFEPKPLTHFRHIGSVAKRMLDWALFDIDEPQSQLADITIHPDTAGISLISTKRKDALRGMKAGEEAARAMLPQIRKLLRDSGIEVKGEVKAGDQPAAPATPAAQGSAAP